MDAHDTPATTVANGTEGKKKPKAKAAKAHTKAHTKAKAKNEAKEARKRAEASADAPPMSNPKFKHVAKRRRSSGRGATPGEIGKSLVELFNSGRAEEVERLWHHKRVESIESDGMVFEGRKGIAEKNAWWHDHHEIHAAQADGPYVGATGFAVRFTMDISARHGPDAGRRMSFAEIGVYTVEKGKIVREEFLAGC